MQKDSEQFKYTRVRDLLTKKPLSVLIKKGYLLPDDFEQTSPRLWSEPLKCYTYLLPELSIHNKEISRSVEEQILKAERAIKKRKLDDSKKDDKNKEDGDFVVDLLSDDEDQDDAKSEGQMGIMWVDAATAPRADERVYTFTFYILLNTTFTGHSCSFSLTHVCWQAIQKQRTKTCGRKESCREGFQGGEAEGSSRSEEEGTKGEEEAEGCKSKGEFFGQQESDIILDRGSEAGCNCAG